MPRYMVILIMTLMSTLYAVPSIALANPQTTSYAKQCFSDPQAAYTYLQQQAAKSAAARQFSLDNSLININKASEAQLTSLHGIGSSKAQQIILFREAFGDFERVEDLTQVQGIGEKTLAKNRHRLRVK